MRHQAHAERLSQRDDLAHLGDPADLGDAGLRDIERAGLEEMPEIVQAGGVLAGGDRDCPAAHAARPV